MSFFSKLFGGGDNKAAPPPPAPSPKTVTAAPPPPPAAPRPATGATGGSASAAASVDHMERTLETLDRKQEKFEKQIEEEIEKAKAYMAAGKKSLALNCMKRKKQYEDQIELLQGQRMNLETTKFAVENAATARVVFEATQRAGAELAAANAAMDPDKVQDTMDSIQEHVQTQKQIAEAMATSIDPVDEDDAEEALMALMKAEAGKQNAAASAAKAASSPAKAPASKANAEAEAELAKLMSGVSVPSQPVTRPQGKVSAADAKAQSEEEKLLAQLTLS